VYSNHALYFVDAPEDFGAWFNDVYRPWLRGTEYRPLMIGGHRRQRSSRERVPYNPSPVGQVRSVHQDDPCTSFSTMPVVDFLAKIVEQKRTASPSALQARDRERTGETSTRAPRSPSCSPHQGRPPELEKAAGDCPCASRRGCSLSAPAPVEQGLRGQVPHDRDRDPLRAMAPRAGQVPTTI